MFDSVGWPEILVLALIGLFVLGPERLPGAVAWVARSVRTVRDYASGAREQLRSELGSEFDQLREPLADLRAIRNMDPRRAVREHLFDLPQDGTWSGTSTPAQSTHGLPAAGDGVVKPQSGAAPRITPRLDGPPSLDPDAT